MAKKTNGHSDDKSKKVTNSIYSLARELSDEYSEMFDIGFSEEDVKGKIKGNSGIVKILKKFFGFDIIKIAKQSEDNNREMIDLIRILFKFIKEKDSDMKSIHKAVAKPYIENVVNEYSDFNKNGEQYFELRNTIAEKIDDADERYERVYNMHKSWQKLIHEMRYDILNNALLSQQQNFDTMSIALDSLLTKIESILKDIGDQNDENYFNPKELVNSDGVMKTFYNILCFYEISCNNESDLRMQKYISDTFITDDSFADKFDSYIEEFKQIARYSINKEDLKNIEDSGGSIRKLSKSHIWRMVTYGDVKEEDKSAYVFAIDNYLSVLELRYRSIINEVQNDEEAYFGSKNEANPNIYDIANVVIKNELAAGKKIIDIVPQGEIIAIFQELISIYKDNIKIKNGFPNYYEDGKAIVDLKNSICAKNQAEGITISILDKRISNRLMANLGSYELCKKYRDVNNNIYKIKRFIMQYQNIDDMEFVSNQLLMMCSRTYLKADSETLLNEFRNGLISKNEELLSDLTISEEDMLFDIIIRLMTADDADGLSRLDWLIEKTTDFISSSYRHSFDGSTKTLSIELINGQEIEITIDYLKPDLNLSYSYTMNNTDKLNALMPYIL